MSQWVRLWEDMPDDPKWRVVAKRSERPLHQVIAVFTRMLVNASKATARGSLEGWSDEDEAMALDMDEASVRAIREAMQGKVLAGETLTGWEKRQPKREDNSTDRVKAFRERFSASKRNETQRNAPEEKREDTEKIEPRQDTSVRNIHLSEPASPAADPTAKIIEFPRPETPKPESKKERKKIEYTPGFVTFWAGYPTDPNMSKTKAFVEWQKLSRPEKDQAIASLPSFGNYCRSHTDYRAVHAERYLRDRRFEGHAESAKRGAAAAGVYVRKETAQWRAWEAHNRAAGKSMMTDKKGDGWYFPTEYPQSSAGELFEGRA